MNRLDQLLAILLKSLARAFYQLEANSLVLKIAQLMRLPPTSTELMQVIETLIQAEDHRFLEHRGIDSRAIARAALVTTLTTRREGGSTITQQLVRVVSRDYRPTFQRKFKELCLAAWIDERVAKTEQAASYLRVAYFGWRMNGIAQAASRLEISFPCTASEAAAIVARLKYPEPEHASSERVALIQRRQLHILERIGKKNVDTP